MRRPRLLHKDKKPTAINFIQKIATWLIEAKQPFLHVLSTSTQTNDSRTTGTDRWFISMKNGCQK